MKLRSLAARVFQFAPNGSVARKIRDCRDPRVSRGRNGPLHLMARKERVGGVAGGTKMAGERWKEEQQERSDESPGRNSTTRRRFDAEEEEDF